jgi:hypothetical protein
MFQMGLHDPFGHLKHKVWLKEGLGIKLSIFLRVGGVPHTIGMFSTRVITLLQTSFQSEVYTQNYGPPKSWESQLWEFRDSHLGVLGQNDIWVLVPWPGTKYTIRGKVASAKFGPL